MIQDSVDVLVAGGGPGGLAAAEAAARSGCSVLVLEAGKEIGSPTRTSGGSFIVFNLSRSACISGISALRTVRSGTSTVLEACGSRSIPATGIEH